MVPKDLPGTYVLTVDEDRLVGGPLVRARALDLMRGLRARFGPNYYIFAGLPDGFIDPDQLLGRNEA